jgi:hypothetical protein
MLMAYDHGAPFRAEHLEQMLQSGERILWQGKPKKRPYVMRRWPLSCFGAVFLGFSLFWTGGVLVMTHLGASAAGEEWPAPLVYLFPLFGLPFILVGAGLTFGHYIFAAMDWKNVEYALTNRRILIRSGARTVTTSSTELADVTGVTATDTPVGTVTFNVVGAGSVPPAMRSFAGRMARTRSGLPLSPSRWRSLASPRRPSTGWSGTKGDPPRRGRTTRPELLGTSSEGRSIRPVRAEPAYAGRILRSSRRGGSATS